MQSGRNAAAVVAASSREREREKCVTTTRREREKEKERRLLQLLLTRECREMASGMDPKSMSEEEKAAVLSMMKNEMDYKFGLLYRYE